VRVEYVPPFPFPPIPLLGLDASDADGVERGLQIPRLFSSGEQADAFVDQFEANVGALSAAERVQIGRGSYLVNAVGDCSTCHTDGIPDGAFDSGLLPETFDVNTTTYLGGGVDLGVLFLLPFQVLSRNLTPHPDTGLELSEDEFIQTLRFGADFRRPGASLRTVPHFPAEFRMTRDDLAAIYTYLRHIPAVDGINLATAAAASHTAHFSIPSVASINRLNQQIAAEAGGFPFSSALGGFSFEFDPATGNFVPTTKTLGPLIAERAATQGQGHLNFNLSYTYLQYDEFSGQSLDDFKVIARHDPDTIGFPDVHDQFEQDVLSIAMDLDISVQLLALSATYGVSDRLDLGLLLPYAFIDMDVSSSARIIETQANELFPGVHTFVEGPELANDRVEGSASGIGDLIFRAKYQLSQSERVNVAGAALVQLGTGDADDFLGTGETAIRPFLVLSRAFGKTTPHLNIGYELNLDHSKRSAFEYALGFDTGTNRYTLAAELLSSHELDGDGIGDDIVDTTWGIKWNPTRQLLLSLNTRFPLNDAGLRAPLITTLSIEHKF